jgi:hypothetical protein
VGVFTHGKEDWTVVTAFTLAAPDKLEKKEATRSIQPRQRLPSRTVNFMIAAMRTGFPANFQHAKNSISASGFSTLSASVFRSWHRSESVRSIFLRSVAVVVGATPRTLRLLLRANSCGLLRVSSLALGSILLRREGNMALSSYFCNRMPSFDSLPHFRFALVAPDVLVTKSGHTLPVWRNQKNCNTGSQWVRHLRKPVSREHWERNHPSLLRRCLTAG